MSQNAQYDDVAGSYQPYAGTGQISADVVTAILRALNPSMGMSPGGGTFNSPYSNLAQQNTAQTASRIYQDMVQGSAGQMRGQVADILAAMPQKIQPFGDQPYTAEQQLAAASAANMAMNLGLPALAATAGGRDALAMVPGGGIVNTGVALADNYKSFLDPMTGRAGMSSGAMLEMNKQMYGNLVGDDLTAQRFNMQGFNTSDIYPMTGYLSRMGKGADGGLEKRLLEDPEFRLAYDRGMVTDEHLKNMGIEDLDAASGPPDSEGARNQRAKGMGNRMSKSLEGAMAMAAAVKETMGPEGRLLESFDELIGNMEQFTTRYNTQLSGKDVANLVRQSTASLKDMGHDWDSIQQIQEYTAQTLAKFGIQGGMTQTVMGSVSANMESLQNMKAFDHAEYGARNIDEMHQYQTQRAGAYVNSDRAASLATIVGVAEDNGMRFRDDEQGQMARKIVRNIQEGADLPEEFRNLTVQEQEEYIAGGLQGTGHLERIQVEKENKKLVEQRIQKNDIVEKYMQQDQRDQFRNDVMPVIVGESLFGLTDGIDGEQSADLMKKIAQGLSDSYTGMSAEQVTDPDQARNIIGSRLISELMNSGDPLAAQMLENLGTSAEEQKANAAMYGSRVMNDIMANTGNVHRDTFAEFSDAATSGKRMESHRQDVKAFLGEVMAGTTNQNRGEAIQALMDKIGTMDSKDITVAGFMEAVDATFKTKADGSIQKQISQSIEAIKELQADIDEIPEDDEADSKLNQTRRQKQATLQQETEFLNDILGGLEAKPDEKAAGKKPGDKSAGSQAGYGDVTFQNLTINISDDYKLQIANAKADKSLPNSTGLI